MLPTPNSALPSGSPPSAGRPRSLDETKLREICALTANGSRLSEAALYVGCDVSTIRREARRNPEFAEKLRRAQRDSELAPLNAIREAAKRSWRAGVWLMERSESERYAMKNARKFSVGQLKKYNAALVAILNTELCDRMRYRRLSRLFNDALHHCIRHIAAGRDPYPLPPEIAGPTNLLPATPPGPSNSAPQSAPAKTPSAAYQATPSHSVAPPPITDFTWPNNTPFLPVPRNSGPTR